MHDERARIGQLQQTEQALGERLTAVIGSAEGLFERLDSLSAGSGQLSEEIERLDGGLRKTSSDLNQQRADLQAHESRLRALDESQQALHKSTESLGVQQARLDNDTRYLQQGLRQRSLLGLLGFLATAVVLGFLLLRGPSVTEALQPTMQADTPAATEPVAAIAELQRETIELRQEVVQLGATVAQASRSVEVLNAAADPQLPGQVTALSESVQNLMQAQAQQRQAHQSVAADQEQLRAEIDQIAVDIKVVGDRMADASIASASAAEELPGQVSDLQATVQNLVRENLHQQRVTAELQTGQAQMQTALAGVVEDVEMLQGRLAQTPAVTAAEPPQDQRWEQARKSGRYTLQLAGFFKRESLQRFVERHRVGDGSAIHQAQYRGRKWFVLFHGIYETVGQAVAAARQLPAGLAAQRPWVRRIPPTGSLSPL
jgi:septal ring-binding cell division protein DamX